VNEAVHSPKTSKIRTGQHSITAQMMAQHSVTAQMMAQLNALHYTAIPSQFHLLLHKI
jgi:hypothetical protein